MQMRRLKPSPRLAQLSDFEAAAVTDGRPFSNFDRLTTAEIDNSLRKFVQGSVLLNVSLQRSQFLIPVSFVLKFRSW